MTEPTPQKPPVPPEPGKINVGGQERDFAEFRKSLDPELQRELEAVHGVNLHTAEGQQAFADAAIKQQAAAKT